MTLGGFAAAIAVPIALLVSTGHACLRAQEEYRPQPIPSAPDAPTRADHVARRVACFRDALVADYRKHGGSDSRWDLHAEPLLGMYARFQGGERDLGSAHHERMLRTGRRALAAGCTDPVVLLAIGDAALMSGQRDVPDELMPRAAEQLEARRSSPLVRFLATNRLHVLRAHRKDADAARAAANRREQLLIAAIADEALAGPNQRIYLDLVRWTFDDELPPDPERLVAALREVRGAHDYPLSVIGARYHVKEAWRLRGGDVAANVTEEGWRGFRQHLDAAAELLTAAHSRHPRFPEAAAEMITVVAGLTCSGREMRLWFDRAVAAEFDCREAYHQLLWFRMPRWGGSHLEMMQIARECVATKRFDTIVPTMYRTALQLISQDSDEKREVYARGVVRQTLDAIHEQRLRRLEDMEQRQLECSEHVVLTALSGREREAARLYQSLDGEFDDRILAHYEVTADWLERTLKPHYCPHVPKTVGTVDVVRGYETATYDESYQARKVATFGDAPTAASWNRRQATWLGASFVSAYRQHGATDAKWDAAAEQVLAEYGPFMLLPRGPDASKQLLAKVAGPLAAGCQDPVVLYVAARVHEVAGEAERALELLRKAAAGLATSSYPDLYAFYVKRRLAALLQARGEADEAARLQPEIVAHAVAAARDPCFGDGNERFYVMTLLAPADIGWRTGIFTREAIDKLTGDESVPAWIRDTISGLYHAAEAATLAVHPWPAAERTAYFEHIHVAESRLQAAHARHPEFPEPAAAMIVVRMMEPGPVGAREWFERALTAQRDHYAAYQNFVWSLRPEFGGSPAAMYAFAVECLESRQFDTEVPMWFATTIEHLAPLLDNWRWIWSHPDVVSRFEQLANKIVEAGANTAAARRMQFGRFMTAWAGGRYDQAVEGWQAMGQQLDAHWLQTFDVEREVVDADLRAWIALKGK